MAWNRNQIRLRNLPTEVYRVYNAGGDLLYVGATVDVFKRFQDHKAYAGWWGIAHTATVARYATRAEARYVEAIAIRDEGPLFNVTRERSEEARAINDPVPFESMHLWWDETGEYWIDREVSVNGPEG